MRIIYLGSFRLPNGDAAAARVLNVARTLRLAGHEISFISWGGLEGDETRSEDGVCKVDGFPFVVTGEIDYTGGLLNKAKTWLQQGNRTKFLLRKQLGQYDAIISYNCSIIGWLVSFCKKNNIKLISDLTEWYSFSELKPISIPKYLWDMTVVQRSVLNKIVISSYLDNYYYESHNIVVPATCDAAEDKWHNNLGYAEAFISPFEGITLIYAGTPAKKDLVHNVVNAVQKLAVEGYPLRFVILGITRDQYLANYSNLLYTCNLHKNIIFLGRVTQDVIPSFYHASDFMIFLRERNRKSNAGFPTKFAESFTSGTPVIANLTSDLGMYLMDTKTGFVVNEPTVESVYNVLKNKVISMDRDNINDLKKRTKAVAVRLDYHSYKTQLKDFINNLK